MTAIANSIKVHLPDGSIKEFPAGSTPFDVAQSISPRLAAASVVARVRPVTAAQTSNGLPQADEEAEAGMYAADHAGAERLVDLSAPLDEDVSCSFSPRKMQTL